MMDFFFLTDLLESINTWVLGIISSLGYPGLGLVMFIENVFPPVPSEVILPLAGSLTARGDFTLAGITLVGMFGSVAGAWVFYGLGYWLGEARVRLLIRRFGRWLLLAEEDLDRALAWFQRHGDGVIFFGRMVPMVRSLISVPAGLAKMSPLRFTLFTALGTALWSFVLALAGRLLGDNWVQVEIWLAEFELVVVAALIAAVIWFVVKKLRRRSRPSAGGTQR